MSEVCGVKVDSSVKGQKFGFLTVIGAKFSVQVKSKQGVEHRWFAVCRCDCGVVDTFNYKNVVGGKSKSCGCYQKEKASESNTTHGATEGRVRIPEYNTWGHMIQRCVNPNNKSWKNYGGRGIKVCDRWLNSFENFLEDMGKRPSKEHSIERVDNEGNYEPDNCVWATSKEQSRNKRSNMLLTVDGESKCVAEWAEIYGISPKTIMGRLRMGWSDEKTVKTPPAPPKRFLEVDGETKRISEMAEQYGTSIEALRTRLKRGWDVERAVKEPVQSNRFLEIDGETRYLSEWAKIYGILPTTINKRLKRGWSAERAVKTPVKSKSGN